MDKHAKLLTLEDKIWLLPVGCHEIRPLQIIGIVQTMDGIQVNCENIHKPVFSPDKGLKRCKAVIATDTNDMYFVNEVDAVQTLVERLDKEVVKVEEDLKKLQAKLANTIERSKQLGSK